MAIYSKETLRALGVGVDRLNDGDLDDRAAADVVVAQMLREGYLYEAGRFLSRNACLVNGHMCPDGVWSSDLTLEEKAVVVRALGALLPETTSLIVGHRFTELPEIIVNTMADFIRNTRTNKGLPFEPADFEGDTDAQGG
jgi:hypothetical protein